VKDALALLGSTNAKEIEEVAWRIWEHEPVLPGKQKAKLNQAVKALGKARKAVEGLEIDDWLPEALEKRKQRYEAEVKPMDVKKRSSGGEIKSGVMMGVSAWEACTFLLEHAIEPTLTKDGTYFKLTALLYKMATGEERDPAHACTAVIEQRRRNQKMAEEQLARMLARMSDDDLAKLGLARSMIAKRR
jgi:hypothetical protein